MLNNQIVNGLKLKHEGGNYYHPIIDNKPYKKILIKDTRCLYGDKTMEIISITEGTTNLFVCPTFENVLKKMVYNFHLVIEKKEVQ